MATLTSRVTTGNFSAQDSWTMTLTANTQSGGDSNTVCICSGAQFITDGVKTGDKIVNTTDGSSATVVTVDSATQITCDGLVDGSDNFFQATDLISIRRVPTTGDDFIVATGHTITIDQDVSCGSADGATTCQVNGILAVDVTANRTIIYRGNWLVNSGGTFNIDCSAVSNVITVTNNNSGTNLQHTIQWLAGSTAPQWKGNKTYGKGSANVMFSEIDAALINATSVVAKVDLGSPVGGCPIFITGNTSTTGEYKTASAYTAATKTYTVTALASAKANLNCVIPLTGNLVVQNNTIKSQFLIALGGALFSGVFFNDFGGGSQTNSALVFSNQTIASNSTLSNCYFYTASTSSQVYGLNQGTINYCAFAVNGSSTIEPIDTCFYMTITNSILAASGENCRCTRYCKDVKIYDTYIYGFSIVHENSPITSIRCKYSGNNRILTALGGAFGQNFYNCDMHYATAATYTTYYAEDCLFQDCKVWNGDLFDDRITSYMYFPIFSAKFVNYNQSIGDNRTYFYEAIFRSESTIRHTASGYSQSCYLRNNDTPTYWQIKVPCVANKAVAVSGYIYKDTNYGSGIQPYVTLEGAGMTTQTWNSFADTASVWQQFTIAGTPTYDGFATLKINMLRNGTNTYVYIDDLVVAGQPIDLGSLDYADKGMQGPMLIASSVNATALEAAVWDAVVASHVTTGTFGKKLLTTAKFLGLK